VLKNSCEDFLTYAKDRAIPYISDMHQFLSDAVAKAYPNIDKQKKCTRGLEEEINNEQNTVKKQ
jgi:hypothetical protein